MARIRSVPNHPPVTINNFLGLNEDTTGETQLQLGESSYMRNYRITENYKLRTREGYKQLFNSLGDKPIQGMWYGRIKGTYYFLFACNGHLYKHNLIDGTNTSIGTLTDGKTTFFYMDGKVYILNGYEYKSFDGTVLKDVEGYIPTIAISTPPSGGGTPYEQANLLTGKKKQLFSGNGTDKVFQLAEKNIQSVDSVEVDGTRVTPSSVDLTTGKVTLGSAPSDNTDNVKIQWTKNNLGDREQITKCRFALVYGGATDSRVFLWGNKDKKNTRFNSGIPVKGFTTAEYFEINANAEVGSGQYAITDIVKQYDRQIIFTEGDSYYSYYEAIIDAQGVRTASFPIYPLNDAIGNVAEGQAQLVQNNPFSIFNGIYEWLSSSVRDERNATHISKRVQSSLDGVDLTKAITVDWEKNKEYWLCVDGVVWVFNYKNNTWYMFDNIPPTCFIEINGELYFGTNKGQIMKFDKNMRYDNGTTINRTWEMAFYDFGSENLRKFVNRLWISLKPVSKTRVNIKWQTDREASTDIMSAYYNLATFNSVNFNHFSFNTSRNPQPFRFKLKAKKFAYFKLIFFNSDPEEIETILSLNIGYRVGGEVK